MEGMIARLGEGMGRVFRLRQHGQAARVALRADGRSEARAARNASARSFRLPVARARSR
jgi:hypothetical protein